MNILELEHVSVTYDHEKYAVDDVSLAVEEGQIIGIVGESGSGKSTILHAIINLLPSGAVQHGSLRFLGKEVRSLSGENLKNLRGSNASIIFQDTGRYMNPISRVGKQYTKFLRCHRSMSREECCNLEREMLQKVHLTDPDRILNSYPFELSGGMKQRVGIAMAMSLKPKLLLADEPTSALDVTVQEQVVYEMMELRKNYGTSIILVTHNMGVAAYMSDYIGVMQNGKLVEWGRTEDVINDPREEYTKSLLDAIIELDDERLLKR